MPSFAKSLRVGTMTTAVLSVFGVAGCGGHDTNDTSTPDAQQLAANCSSLASKNGPSPFPISGTNVLSSVVVPATATAPQQCQVDGEINRRTGVDGQSYAIRFRLRLPITGWNGRFYMGGGGGTDGTLVDPQDVAALGYATIHKRELTLPITPMTKLRARVKQWSKRSITALPSFRTLSVARKAAVKPC
jgi:feruloyl esterase